MSSHDSMTCGRGIGSARIFFKTRVESDSELKKGVLYGGDRKVQLRAIRKKCLDCCCGNDAEGRRCAIATYALWPFRMGKNPNRKGLGPKLPTFAKPYRRDLGAHDSALRSAP
jgi:hypothetical protein